MTITPHGSSTTTTLHHGDCLDIMRELPDNSVDAIVTDPPYGLGFMGKDWDDLPPGLPWARECLRVLKPGGHLLAFGGTRTWHRLACAVEDAGFEVRDSIAWMYGSGFPKSLDVSKAIDKAAGREAAPTPQGVVDAGLVGGWLRDQCAQRGVTSRQINDHFQAANIALRWLLAAPTQTKRPQVPRWEQWVELRTWLALPDDMDAEVWRLNGLKGQPAPLAFQREAKTYRESHGFARVGLEHGAQKSHTATAQVEEFGYATGPGDAPATDAARTWQGWGTALKPAFEPVVVARKPLAAGTVAANVLAHGTGALNVDGCRVEGEPWKAHRATGLGSVKFFTEGETPEIDKEPHAAGRWPANVVLDESQAAALDQQSGTLTSGKMLAGTKPKGERETYGQDAAAGYETQYDTPGDTGGASRFFFVANEDDHADEYVESCPDCEWETHHEPDVPIDLLGPRFRYEAKADASERPRIDGIAHATVKPLALMRWLVRLVTPPGGTVLEPFAGSGTTVEACILEGFRCIAIEREADYLPLIMQRINRRVDPVAAVAASGEDGGLFDLLDADTA